MTMLDLIRGLGPSIIRTVSPWLVGLVVTGLARVGLDWTPGPEVLGFVTGVVGMAWYAGVRWLEERKDSRWGWLLGLPGAPSYPEHAPAVSPERVEPVIPGTTLPVPAEPLDGPNEDYR